MAVTIKDLDHSPGMRAYFDQVADCMERRHGLQPAASRRLIDRYFSLDVSPTERVFTMHINPTVVAADLASIHLAETEDASIGVD